MAERDAAPALLPRGRGPGGFGSPSVPTMRGRPSVGWWGPEEGREILPIQRWKAHPSVLKVTVPRNGRSPRWSAGGRARLARRTPHSQGAETMVRHPALRPFGLKARGEKCKEGSAAPQVREGFRTPRWPFAANQASYLSGKHAHVPAKWIRFAEEGHAPMLGAADEPEFLADRSRRPRQRPGRQADGARPRRAPTTANCSSNTSSPRCWCSTTAASSRRPTTPTRASGCAR